MERTPDHLTPLEMVVNILPFSPIPLVTRLPHLLEDVKNPPGRADFLIPGSLSRARRLPHQGQVNIICARYLPNVSSLSLSL